MNAPIPTNETERIAALKSYKVLDSAPEEAFDRITRLLAAQFDVPIALVSLVDEDRQWFKSRFGLDAEETPRDVAFCAHAICGESIFAVPDALDDPRFSDNPLVTESPGIRSYYGAPMRNADGYNLGSLCVIDMKPRAFTEPQLRLLTDLAGVVVDYLEVRHAGRQVARHGRSAVRAAEQVSLEKTRELEASEERLQDIISNVPGVVYQFKIDIEGRANFPFVSETIRNILGLDPTKIMADPETWLNIIQSDDRARLDDSIAQTRRTLTPCLWEGRMTRASGEVGWFRASSTPRRLDDGSVQWNGIVLDITEQKLAELALKENQARFKDFAESASDWFWEMDSDLRFTAAPNRYGHVSELRTRADLRRRREELSGFEVDPEVWAAHERTLREHQPFRDFTYRRRMPDGRVKHVSTSGMPVFGEDGEFLGYRGTASDITALVEAQASQAEAENRLARAMELSPGVFALFDSDDRLVICNEQYRAMYETPMAPITPGVTFEDLVRAFAAQVGIGGSDEETETWVAKRLDRRRKPAQSYDYQRSDGEWIEVSDFILEDGSVFTVGNIITERKRMEAELRQAQKMEAVGNLTGGVAHDFNNLLGVIMGNAELLEDSLGSDDKQLHAIVRAATRGSELTQRMLAFSRQQPLRPQSIDLWALVSGMSNLLTRTLGETIEIETRTAPDLWSVSADPGQVENVLLNLALNARDAMPDGGKLTIACENVHLDASFAVCNREVEAGDYLVLSVSDNGTGMSAEVRARAFDPFFTTKDVGEGSGLGLSMVYGFAKQSGGQVTIYSEEGRGTTVKLYLPRTGKAPDSGKADQDADTPRGQDEVILVIEDDPDVRDLSVQMLEGLGYRVINAPHAARARELLANGTHVDLVLSDVVLPGGTSGPEFAEEARTLRPDLMVIFMSGYPAEAATRNGLLGPDTVLLNKPFHRRQLATALRTALDQSAR